MSASTETFAATLLKAVMEVESTALPVLLCVYDIPYPPPLQDAVPIRAPFGAAFVLAPDAAQAGFATAAIRMVDGTLPADRPRHAFWEYLFDGNPAARSIPFIERLASPQGGVTTESLCVGRVGSRSLTVELAL